MAVADCDDAYIKHFISSTFNKQISIVRKLPSYQDTNIVFKDEHCNTMYVLKIFKRQLCDAEHFTLERKTKIADYLRQQGFLCPRFITVADTDGQFVHGIKSPETQSTHPCLLYIFLPGSPLEKAVDISQPIIMFELGSLLGQIHKTLYNIPHEGLEPDPTDPWCMCNIHLLSGEKYQEIVKNTGRSQKLQGILNFLNQRFKSTVPLLQKSILHGDFHSQNLIVDRGFTTQSRISKVYLHEQSKDIFLMKLKEKKFLSDFTLSYLSGVLANQTSNSFDIEELLRNYGIVDFEAVNYSYRILEVGRVIADLMVTILSERLQKCISSKADTDVTSLVEERSGLKDVSGATKLAAWLKFQSQDAANNDGVITEKNSVLKKQEILSTFPDILNVGGFVLSGYLMNSILTSDELDFLKEAVMISLAQYFILGSEAALEDPDNVEYNSQCSKEAELLLFEFYDYSMNPEELYRAWTEAAFSFLSGDQSH